MGNTMRGSKFEMLMIVLDIAGIVVGILNTTLTAIDLITKHQKSNRLTDQS